jgi:hypothetical protein
VEQVRPGQFGPQAGLARYAAHSFGADRLVLGTDSRTRPEPSFERAVSYITTSGLVPGDADCMLSVNVEALFSWRDP